jgi:hypothetical protein
MVVEFRPYRARLLWRGQPRHDGAWFLLELDLRVGGDLDASYDRLAELWRRLIKADGANRSELDHFALEVQPVPPVEGEQLRWVPNRPDRDRKLGLP